jgi:hypothetical protein
MPTDGCWWTQCRVMAAGNCCYSEWGWWSVMLRVMTQGYDTTQSCLLSFCWKLAWQLHFQVLCRFSLYRRHIGLILFICTGYVYAVNCRESSAVCLVMKREDTTCLLCVAPAVIMYLLGGKPSLCVACTWLFLLLIASHWSCCTLWHFQLWYLFT